MTITLSNGEQRREKKNIHIALVSMPWSIFNRPSIQLGTLKAYLAKTCDWISVQNFHPYLQVADSLGNDVYHEISLNVWLCESLYAPLLFPEQREEARTVFEKERRKFKLLRRYSYDDAVALLENELHNFLKSQDWLRFDLIGFTVCFNQLFSSLAAAKLLKNHNPNVPIVFGGSSCADTLAGPLLKSGAIDYVIAGEGEERLVSLCEYLSGRTDFLPNSIYADTLRNKEINDETARELSGLTALPQPDYDDYFKEMRANPGKQFIPVLPVEFSRGCWWRKCAFCNLNLQWQGYRAKESRQMVNEVLELSVKYSSLDFAFTDNALPVKQSIAFFEDVQSTGKDFNFFAEVRANMRGEKLALCRRGGLRTAQVGIEALSDTLLSKMIKGTSVIENIAIMRDAVEYGVQLEGNLIVEFPDSTLEEVEETLTNLDYVLPFHPLNTAAFFLGLGSPVDADPYCYGITSNLQHPTFVKLFPKQHSKQLPVLIKGYRGDRLSQKKMWKPVVDKVIKWHEFHQQRGGSCIERPALSYRDGGEYLIIRQERINEPVLHHTLRGTSRKIYLFCANISDINRLEHEFSNFSREQLASFLDGLMKKRLVFKEKEKYLSLAVRAR